MASEHDEDVEVRGSDVDGDAQENADPGSEAESEPLKSAPDSLVVEAQSKPQASASEDDHDAYESCGGASDENLATTTDAKKEKKKRKKKSKLGLDGTITEPEDDIVPIVVSEAKDPDTTAEADHTGDHESKNSHESKNKLSAQKSGSEPEQSGAADGEPEHKHHHRTHTYSRNTSTTSDKGGSNQSLDEDDKARAKRERKEARKALKEQLRKERKIEKEFEEAARLKREAEERARIEAERIAEEKRRKIEHHRKMKAAKLAKRETHVQYLERMLEELQTRLANARLDLERVQGIHTDDDMSDTSIDTDSDSDSDSDSTSDSDSDASAKKSKSKAVAMSVDAPRGPPSRTNSQNRPPPGQRPLSGGRGMQYGHAPNRHGQMPRPNSRGPPGPPGHSREGSNPPAGYGGPPGPPGPPGHMPPHGRPHSRGQAPHPNQQRNNTNGHPHLPPGANSRAQTLYSANDPQSYGVDAKTQLEADMDQYRRQTYEKAKGSERVAAEDLDAYSKAHEGGRQTQVTLRKTPDESLGFMITETSRSSLLPCVFVSHIYPGGAASRSNLLHVGDTILAVNGVSLVGLPFKESLKLFKDLSLGTEINLTVVPVDPAVTVTIDRRMSPAGKLGLDVLHAEIVAVDKGGAAELAGVKPGHLIMEVNGQSVVGWDHESIVRSMKAEIVTLKTMPRDLFATLMKHENSRLEKKPRGANRNI